MRRMCTWLRACMRVRARVQSRVRAGMCAGVDAGLSSMSVCHHLNSVVRCIGVVCHR